MIRLTWTALTLAIVFVAAAARAETATVNFEKKCSLCHGKDGKGHTSVAERMGIKDLTTAAGTTAELAATIANGRGKMPAFKGKLSEAEIEALAAHVKAGLK